MTEIERLIEEGIFDKKFFREEIRCNHTISSKLKKVWAIEIDLLLQLDKLCRKFNLKYYLMFGSLLGAIRHNGFIPWDDDLDVCMPRSDYERLLNIGRNEFKYPYFLQTPESDPGYYYTFAKLRNSRTTAFLDLFQYQKINMGILIDIFPVDVCSMSDVEENFKKIQRLTKENTTYMRMSNQHLSKKEKERVMKYNRESEEGDVPFDRYLEIQKIASQYENERDKSDKRIVAVFYRIFIR